MWFDAGKKEARNLYRWIERNIAELLAKHDRNVIVSVGIDGKSASDQIAIAISKNGFEAVGRKFFPTKEEKHHIKLARDYISKEGGYERIFELNGKRYYLAVCYDIFGIKKLNIENPHVNAVLNLIHRFKKT